MKKRGSHKFNILFAVSLVLTLVSCEKIAFPDPGEQLKIHIEYNYFSKVSIYSVFDVVLQTDSIYSLVIETYEAYADRIVQSLDSENLVVKDENSLKWLPDYPRPKIRILFPRLDDKLLIEEPVNLTCIDTLHLPYLNLLSSGKVGDFNLNIDVDNFTLTTGSDNYGYYIIAGKATKSKLWSRGSSIVEASELLSSECNVYNNSIGDCTVKVSDRLVARLNTMGNVYYSGNPEIVELLEESGSGRLFEVED